MKICIISKFPPIQGGISAKTYWLARGLAEAGLEVHIVTNAQAVEEDYRISSCDTDLHLPQGLIVHNMDQETPWHIPYSQLYQEKLLDKVLKVCSQYKIDLIDSHYLIPYGITAFIASKILGIPYIIRHGGSDLTKFWQQGLLKNLLKSTLINASVVVSDKKEFTSLNPRNTELPPYVPDNRHFKTLPSSKKENVFAYVGKINYYWRHKSLDTIISFWRNLKIDSRLYFLAQGRGKEAFIRCCKPEEVQFLDFIPPWEMPSFLQKIGYLFYLVQNSPVQDFSNIVVEAVACGVYIITDNPKAFDFYQPYFDVLNFVVPMNGFCPSSHTSINIISHPIKSRYDEYILNNIELYSKCVIGD